MKQSLVKLLTKELEKTIDKLNAGTCELSDDEMIEIMQVISHQALSKEQACSYLNMSRSKFDELVKLGILPKGKKQRGFKELRWYKDELTEYKK